MGCQRIKIYNKIEDKNIIGLINKLSVFGKKSKTKQNTKEELRKYDIIWQKVDICCNKSINESLRDYFKNIEGIY
ncbi:MAG: hypothetical protein N2511_07105 [Thermodesulfovibrionales bacterium]|nr:hypothetical protein [Thermodesulfovibrionales bacterium]